MKRRSKSRSAPAPELPAGVERDLVQDVARAPRLHGLDSMIARVAQLITTEGRRPVLVGAPEVGKTAVVWGLAQRIAAGERPAGAKAIWEVSLRTLDEDYGKDVGAGRRLAAILTEAAASPEKPIVYVSDLRMLRAVDAEHAMVEALLHTRVPFLGEAWPGYAAWLTDDSELASVTHMIRVEEPSVEAATAMLRAEARAVEQSCGVHVEPSAIDRLVYYVDRLQPHRRFAGKALALLDEVVREAGTRGDRVVTPALVTDRVCESMRLPRALVDPDTAFDVAGLRAHLRERIVGQDEAIDAVVERLALYKSELCDPDRPLGVLLFAGPPGVGKSQIAREIAAYVFGSEHRLVRISLAEHSEDWKVDQLFGQRGSQAVESRRGVLSRQLAGKPFAVVLLDEIEKAHPLAYKHLLRPLEEGSFVNGNDEEILLRNTLVILATSIGQDVYRESGVGFTRVDSASVRRQSVEKRVNDTFPSDLLDRIDRVCVCPPLLGSGAEEYARREAARAIARSRRTRGSVNVEIRDAVFAAIAERGRNENGQAAGARGMRRVLDRDLIAQLAVQLNDRPRDGTLHLVVDVQNGSITFERNVVAQELRPSRTEAPAREDAARSRSAAKPGPRVSDSVRPAERASARRPSHHG